jgi:rhodanese-related sulfurtransferase
MMTSERGDGLNRVAVRREASRRHATAGRPRAMWLLLLAMLVALAPAAGQDGAPAAVGASADCTVDAALPTTTGKAGGEVGQSLPAPTVAPRSAARYVTAPAALAQREAADSVMVDLRRPAEVAELRIPGALDIPPHQVKTKAFLRGKRVLLLDAGYRYHELERTAADLEAAGIPEVAIVEGGVNAWQAAGGALVGPASAARLRRVAPAAFAAEARFPHWRVVVLEDAAVPAAVHPVAGDAEHPAATVAGPAGHLLAAPAARLGPEAADRLPELVAELSAGGDDGLTPLILLVDANGRTSARLLAQLGDAAPWNLFLLDGGLAAWQTEVRKLAAIAARRLAPPRQPAACGG